MARFVPNVARETIGRSIAEYLNLPQNLNQRGTLKMTRDLIIILETDPLEG